MAASVAVVAEIGEAPIAAEAAAKVVVIHEDYSAAQASPSV